jgi:beta-galactosidase/beta-glucuronidase
MIRFGNCCIVSILEIVRYTQTDLGNMAASGQVRICLLIPRKKGMSEQEFHDYWSKIHGPLVREWSVER